METDRRSQGQVPDIHRMEISVDWPPGQVAATVIDGEEPILVDAGMVGEKAASELQRGLAEAGLTRSDIDHLVVTHPHVDHLGQIPALLEAADPTVYAPAGVRERLGRDPNSLETTVRSNGKRAGLEGSTLDMAIEKSIKSLKRNRALLDPDVVDHWLDHDEGFEVGTHQFRAIHTPGHQADHCCYHGQLNGVRVLFSGDLLLEPFRSIVLHTGLDDGVEDGVRAFYTALDRLEVLDVDRVYPGHGPAHTQLEETIDRSRNSLRRLLDHTRDLVADGAETAIEVALQRSTERDIEYVVPEVVSAISHLEAHDELRVTVADGTNRYYADCE